MLYPIELCGRFLSLFRARLYPIHVRESLVSGGEFSSGIGADGGAGTQFEAKRNAYHSAGAGRATATTAEPLLALGRAALAYVAVGGHVHLDRVIASVRRARKLGAKREADTLEAKLVALRATAR